MAKWLWRVNPKPEPVPEPEPVAAPKRAPVVDVTDSVWRAANQIAQRVWSGVPQPRTYLLRWDPPGAGRYVDFAVSQQWLRVDGDMVSEGAVSPYPVERTTHTAHTAAIGAWSRPSHLWANQVRSSCRFGKQTHLRLGCRLIWDAHFLQKFGLEGPAKYSVLHIGSSAPAFAQWDDPPQDGNGQPDDAGHNHGGQVAYHVGDHEVGG